MKKLLLILFLYLAANCQADSFTHKETGKVLYGYPTLKKKHEKTRVRVGPTHEAKYLDLSKYTIEQNGEGRRNEIVTININYQIEYDCVMESLEKTIEREADRGPQFILFEIDTPGGRIDLTKRICKALGKIDNCRTVAFVNENAISAGAIITMACDEVYMTESATIGGATAIANQKDLREVFGETVGEKYQSVWQAFCEGVANKNNRPAKIVQAMINKDISVVEVVDEGNHLFIDPNDKKPSQELVKVWSDIGSLVTLTASKAVECGIADGIVKTKEELVSQFTTKKVTRRVNRDNRKIREAYIKLIGINARIEALVTSENELIDKINENNNIIAKTEKQVYSVNSGSRNSRNIVKREYATGARNALQFQFKSLKKISNKLIKEYKAAISTTRNYPELAKEKEELRRRLELERKFNRKL